MRKSTTLSANQEDRDEKDLRMLLRSFADLDETVEQDPLMRRVFVDNNKIISNFS